MAVWRVTLRVRVRIRIVLYKHCILQDHTVQHCNSNLMLYSSCGLRLHRHSTILYTPTPLQKTFFVNLPHFLKTDYGGLTRVDLYQHGIFLWLGTSHEWMTVLMPRRSELHPHWKIGRDRIVILDYSDEDSSRWHCVKQSTLNMAPNQALWMLLATVVLCAHVEQARSDDSAACHHHIVIFTKWNSD